MDDVRGMVLLPPGLQLLIDLLRERGWTVVGPTVCGGVVVHAVPADHGDFSATALCLVLEFDGLRVFCTGDTAFRPQLFQPLADLHPDVLLPVMTTLVPPAVGPEFGTMPVMVGAGAEM